MLNYGIIGRKGSGKSTLSKYLIEHSEFAVANVKFADPLKDMCRTMLQYLGYDDETREQMIEGNLKEQSIYELGITPRHMMQTLGTEWGRDCVTKDVWGILWEKTVDQLIDDGVAVVCDDLRFDNEVRRASRLDLNNMRVVSIDEETSDTHASEALPKATDLDISVFILNDKTPFVFNRQELEEQLLELAVDDIIVVYQEKFFIFEDGRNRIAKDVSYAELMDTVAYLVREIDDYIISDQDEANRRADDLYALGKETRYESN